MADGERKRKRSRANGDQDRPKKKAAMNGSAALDPSTSIKISHLKARNLCPVVATSSGDVLPNVSFQAYSKSASEPLDADSLLLHSSEHPKLDFTAGPDSNPLIRHYIGVFDPVTNSLQIHPAQATVLRNTLRAEVAEVHQQDSARSMALQREDLGLAFGTKKAKRSIASKSENAIDAAGNKDAENAMLESVKEATDNLPGRDDQTQAILDSKPIPKPNLDAQSIDQVYPLNVLVPSADLRTITVKDWQDAVAADQDIELTSRFVANRMTIVANGGDAQKLKALRYILLLLHFYNALGQARGGRRVPPRDQLKAKMADWQDAQIDAVRRRFADGGDLSKWHVDRLFSHIAALSLYIDGWRTDTHELQEDLRLDVKQMSQYFLELGCRVAPPTEKERAEMKITNKALASQKRIAKLKLPLEFPKARLPPRRR